MNFIPKLSTIAQEAGKIVGALIVIVPVCIGAWNWTASAADQRAQAYIQRVVDQRFNELGSKVDKLTAAINRLSTGQSAVNQQSVEQERLSRQILCLQHVQADPSSGTVDGCMAGQ